MANKVYKTASGVLVEAVSKDAGAYDGLNAVVENTVEAAVEKHIPVVEKVDGGFKVVVGEVSHPMADDHWIEWIEVSDGKTTQRKVLDPGEEPVAVFLTEAASVEARAYCNLHGLWKSA